MKLIKYLPFFASFVFSTLDLFHTHDLLKISTHAICCPTDFRLSKYGYCGTGNFYCSEGSRTGPCYGVGGGDNSSYSTSDTKRFRYGMMPVPELLQISIRCRFTEILIL